MREIEVGEYVRTFNGLIGQVVQITDYGYAIRIYNGAEYVVRAVIKKHSKNLIDLIEPGDIVNGHGVRKVYLDGAVKYIKLDNAYSPENHFTGVRTYEDDIKTILTKEQMEANQYVVKRNMETN